MSVNSDLIGTIEFNIGTIEFNSGPVQRKNPRKANTFRGFTLSRDSGQNPVEKELQAQSACFFAQLVSVNGRIRLLQTIQNLIGPEPLKTGQRLVQAIKLIDVNAGNFTQRQQLPVVKRVNLFANHLTTIGQ